MAERSHKLHSLWKRNNSFYQLGFVPTHRTFTRFDIPIEDERPHVCGQICVRPCRHQHDMLIEWQFHKDSEKFRTWEPVRWAEIHLLRMTDWELREWGSW